MNRHVKALQNRSVACLLLTLCISTAAHAGVWVPGPMGPVYEPICHEIVNQVWVQTGPYPGQGYWQSVYETRCD